MDEKFIYLRFDSLWLSLDLMGFSYSIHIQKINRPYHKINWLNIRNNKIFKIVLFFLMAQKLDQNDKTKKLHSVCSFHTLNAKETLCYENSLY